MALSPTVLSELVGVQNIPRAHGSSLIARGLAVLTSLSTGGIVQCIEIHGCITVAWYHKNTL